MRSPPEEIEAKELTDCLGRHWGLEVDRLDYLPEGGGAHHWVAETDDGQRRFVTVDDLDTKPWLGSDRDSVFAGLLGAYRVATDLRRSAGLAFVVAPVPAISADAAVRLDARHSLAVFPLVEGRAGRWGEPMGAASRARLVGLLAQLHHIPPAVTTVAWRGLGLPGRERLDEAIGEVDRPWAGGPFSEAARKALVGQADVVAAWLATYDDLASTLGQSGFEPVITHGEPHPGNLIRTDGGFALVDWDTVALARAERDLWMLDDGSGVACSAYQGLTGHALDPCALAFYRLQWALGDLAAFTAQLRAPHPRNADSEKALMAIRQVLASEEPAPYGRAADHPPQSAPDSSARSSELDS